MLIPSGPPNRPLQPNLLELLAAIAARRRTPMRGVGVPPVGGGAPPMMPAMGMNPSVLPPNVLAALQKPGMSPWGGQMPGPVMPGPAPRMPGPMPQGYQRR